jgi:pimeloyl-ACP methyl ester carboxylesterase
VTVVLVHGFPETPAIWRPLQQILEGDVVAVGLPGFGATRTAGFSGTKDAYAEWLGETLGRVDEPVDVVAHDVGALLTMRVVSAFAVAVRSWTVDVADIFHPRFAWPQGVRELQIPERGEQILKTSREVDPVDPRSSTSRLIAGGVPYDLAREIGSAHDAVMSRSILDFYRSAAPNVAADWWNDVAGPTRSRGLVLLLPDPPEVEAMSLEVAERLGAQTARLEGLGHCWMAEAPAVVARALERFWSSLT